MKKKKSPAETSAGLRHRAEIRLRKRRKQPRSRPKAPQSTVDLQRTLHELQVHQVELELQNEELQRARELTEAGLEKYADLYDFAPVGYFTLNGEGRILEVNLQGATLLNEERSTLIHRRLLQFVAPSSRAAFRVFLTQALEGTGIQVFETQLVRQDGTSFWAGFHTLTFRSTESAPKECQMSVSDVTPLKYAEK